MPACMPDKPSGRVYTTAATCLSQRSALAAAQSFQYVMRLLQAIPLLLCLKLTFLVSIDYLKRLARRGDVSKAKKVGLACPEW
jgi:hypothetical protein